MDKKIQEIRTALAAATPGPWVHSALVSGYIVTDYEPYNSVASVVEFNEDGSVHMIFQKAAHNSFLIAKAPEYISYLLQQIEIKDKALEFYADKKNYEQEKVNFDAEGIDVYWEAPEVQNDAGERARAALKGEDTSE
ncbi:hypothetical protein [Paenibacillus polymyxa]|uniref:hypothetical protein n=1 Tax=Paenibacillus polymyxa TaxID=1406 RepID=UPI002379A3E8|nr:hypothetical protein [Paenibacillus polymyxa]WDM22629.1 hypothetical protein J4I02_03135 [Paenibacillus polymyxa]